MDGEPYPPRSIHYCYIQQRSYCGSNRNLILGSEHHLNIVSCVSCLNCILHPVGIRLRT